MKNTTRSLGLRFRMRHLFILVTYFALLLGVLVPILRYTGAASSINGSLVILLASPWLLGILVLLVERKGPVKYWAAPLLLSLTGPALAISHDWVLVNSWQRTGSVPNALVCLVVNILLVGSFSLYFISMYPGCCPRCGHRSLIPLLHLRERGSRNSQTRWCGSCGAKYWRNSEGLWQKERRSTWVDALIEERETVPGPTDAPASRPHSDLGKLTHLYPAPLSRSARRDSANPGSSVHSE